MESVDALYADLLERLAARGESVSTRNATTRRLIAEKFTFTRTPLVTARRTAWRNALREMEWFLSGSCDINDLHPAVRSWWAPWANARGEVLNNYSEQFRGFFGKARPGPWGDGGPVEVDQIDYLVRGIRDHPNSRRLVITTWNTAEMLHPSTPITNCHGTVIQAFVSPATGALHLVTYQRSVDAVCGLPHNWIQYWALLLWLADQGGRGVGSLTWVGGDVHLYEQHADLARRIVAAAGGVPDGGPELVYAPGKLGGADFAADHFSLCGEYAPVFAERAEMVV